MKNRRTGFLSLLGLTVQYWALRYPLFFLHGMKAWPLTLFVPGAIIITVSGVALCRKALPVFAAAGYGVGFILGYVFQWDYGRGQNSLWIIWACVYLAFLILGIVIEFLKE